MPNNDAIAFFALYPNRSSLAFLPAAEAILPTAFVDSPMGPLLFSAAYFPPSAVIIAKNGPLYDYTIFNEKQCKKIMLDLEYEEVTYIV